MCPARAKGGCPAGQRKVFSLRCPRTRLSVFPKEASSCLEVDLDLRLS